MAYENPLMVELMIPRSPDSADRTIGFYRHIGWEARVASDSDFFMYVSPEVSEGAPPTVGYWQTENADKLKFFGLNESEALSIYARGLRLPLLRDLVEVCLIVPTDDDVHRIFEEGGSLLERHTHIKPRDHAGAQEFRFADPFNYSLRVTANPGWEIQNTDNNPTSSMFIGRRTFSDNWTTNQGAGGAWGRMSRLARDNPSFPLQHDGYDGPFHGDLPAAISWLTEGGYGGMVVTKILRNIQKRQK